MRADFYELAPAVFLPRGALDQNHVERAVACVNFAGAERVLGAEIEQDGHVAAIIGGILLGQNGAKKPRGYILKARDDYGLSGRRVGVGGVGVGRRKNREPVVTP